MVKKSMEARALTCFVDGGLGRNDAGDDVHGVGEEDAKEPEQAGGHDAEEDYRESGETIQRMSASSSIYVATWAPTRRKKEARRCLTHKLRR